MSKETILPKNSLVLSIIDMAKQTDPDWESIDKNIAGLKELDSISVADSLFELSDSSNANIMDAIASSLNSISLSDDQRINQAIELLLPICLSTDEDFIYASGRSALFLNQFKDKDSVNVTLNQFRQNVQNSGVRENLIENIPNIESVL